MPVKHVSMLRRMSKDATQDRVGDALSCRDAGKQLSQIVQHEDWRSGPYRHFGDVIGRQPFEQAVIGFQRIAPSLKDIAHQWCNR
ncbi:Uncharacterised protein [Burkholderia pseudomallei]|nr:hypothetical protein DR54_2836 [Burkholderia pseudomallei HBPUB10303a]KIX58315.1 hypothetical protein SZ31_18620 [Burkholderia pseudomallei]OAG62894.1 hypothetical protein BIM11_3673 [Burkholderia pseudomallei]CAJ2768656.1 Uncharacterised protein [Burkholderia pseudomallei]CAJ3290997.1 Uncharacterised protein [Burkholderia pseudomallei]